MLKSLARTLVDLYLRPLRLDPRLQRYAKHAALLDPAEHLRCAVDHLRRSPGLEGATSIIDVGGADGGVSLYFASQFAKLQVYCVEPNADHIPSIRQRMTRAKNITHMRMALGDAEGEATLHVTANKLSSSLSAIDREEISCAPESLRAAMAVEGHAIVQVSTMDKEFASLQVALVKLDTQGTELSVLRGGRRVLESTRFVLTEMNNHHLYANTCQYYEVDQLLRECGFRLVDLIVTYRGEAGVGEFDALYGNERWLPRGTTCVRQSEHYG